MLMNYFDYTRSYLIYNLKYLCIQAQISEKSMSVRFNKPAGDLRKCSCKWRNSWRNFFCDSKENCIACCRCREDVRKVI